MQSSLAQSQADARAAALELVQLLSRPETLAPPRIREGGAPADRGPVVADSMRALTGLELVPEVRLAHLDSLQHLLDLREAARRKGLTVRLAADAGLSGADLTTDVPPDLKAENPNATFGDRLKRDLGASISLEFSKPLVDATVGPAVAARRRALEAARLRRQNQIATQRRTILELLSRWRSAEERRVNLLQLVGRADQNLLRAKSLNAGGCMTLLELLDARHVWADALDRHADATAEERKSRLSLEIRR